MITTEQTKIPGALIVRFPQHEDHRGTFEESYHAEKFDRAGLPPMWLQDNLSVSYGGVIRGLHLQKVNPQGKLVRCLQGSIWDVCVDLRAGSPTFGEWTRVHLRENDQMGFYLPPGTAHGFLALERRNVVHYKCTTLYEPGADGGVAWDDEHLGIPWPIDNPERLIVSAKDRLLPGFLDYAKTLS